MSYEMDDHIIIRFFVCGIAILICLMKMLFGINHEIQELKLD